MLDQSLYREEYVGLQYPHNREGETTLIINNKQYSTDKLTALVFEECHWVDFYELHNWFVNNVDDEWVDEKNMISPFKLEELLNILSADFNYLLSCVGEVEISNLQLKRDRKFNDASELESYIELLKRTHSEIYEAIQNDGAFYYGIN